MYENTTFIPDNQISMNIFADYNDMTSDDCLSYEDFERECIAEILEADDHAENKQMPPSIRHQWEKATRRYNRFKRRTSSRDKRGTLKAQYWEHCEKMYHRGDRHKLLDNAKKNEMSLFFKTDIYDVRAEQSVASVGVYYDDYDYGNFELMEPWHNDALVLYLFDECSARFIREECLSMHSIFELETLRTYFELGKCRISINPDFGEYEVCSLENFFRLVIDEDAYDLLCDVTYRYFLCKLAARLYELHMHEDLHIRYLRKLLA